MLKALNLQRAVDMVMGRVACDTALVHARVVDVFGREILENRTVLVGEGRVLAVLADDECRDVQAGEIVDCQGQTLLPGLMDAHVHIESTMLTPPSFARAGRVLDETRAVAVPDNILHSVHVKELDSASLALPVPSGKARVIGLLPHSLCTKSLVREVRVDAKGNFDAAGNPGLCKIAVFERHKNLGLVGLGILEHYALEGRLLGGALATSISHDSHNIVVAGSSDRDMIAAVSRVVEMNGGIAIVQNGVCTADLPLPVAGLMSEESAEWVAHRLSAIEKAALGFAVSPDIDPVMTLSFMALCVIPELRVHTRGLFDVTDFSFVSVDAGEEQDKTPDRNTGGAQ